VNPGKPVPLKTVRLTHIEPSQLADSPFLRDLVPTIQEFRGDLPLVGHNSAFDAAFLTKHISGFPGVPLYDTLELARIAVPGLRSYKLADIGREMGVAVSEAHRACDDAEVSGSLFGLVQAAIGAMREETRLVVRYVMGDDWGASGLFAGRPAGKSLAAAAFAAATARSWVQPALLAEPAGVGHGSAICRRVSELLAAGERATAVNVPLSSDAAAEAVRAASDYAFQQGKRVLLLGFPEGCLPAGSIRTGLPQDFACLARLEEASRQARSGAYAGLDVEERRFLASLYRWVEQACDGAFAGVQMGNAGHEVAPEVACPPAMECRDSCSKAASCFYLRNVARTSRSPGQGLVAFASLHSGLGVAAPYDAVLMWSSHDLPRAWQGRESRVDLPKIREAARQAGILAAVPALEPLEAAAQAGLTRGGPTLAEAAGLAREVAEQVAAAALSFRAKREASLPEGRAGKVDPPMLWKDLHTLEASSAGLRAFAEGTEGEAPLVEQSYGEDGPRGAALVRRAVWPASAAQSALSQATGAGLLLFSDVNVAAARSDGGRRALGLDFGSGEPVDLSGMTAPESKANVLLAVLDAGRAVAPNAYAGYLEAAVVGLAPEVRKGFLVTFPSRALLKETYSLVQPVLEEEGVAVYGQGIDGGHKVVEHLEEDRSVVFALAGTGPSTDDPVPVCLLLARVPFPPPNPLDDLRRAQIASSGGDGFVEVNVRPSAISLRAYVERMAGSGRRCAVVLADPRLLPNRSSWGQEFMRSLDDLPKLVCPEREMVSRVSAHLRT
jgi:hypothetical protein